MGPRVSEWHNSRPMWMKPIRPNLSQSVWIDSILATFIFFPGYHFFHMRSWDFQATCHLKECKTKQQKIPNQIIFNTSILTMDSTTQSCQEIHLCS
jgi:hypothetical protein